MTKIHRFYSLIPICLGILFFCLPLPAFSNTVFSPDSLGIHVVDGKTYILHEVEHGETLYSISRRYGVSVEDIIAANAIIQQNQIQIGQVLKIPLAVPVDSNLNKDTDNSLINNKDEKETELVQYTVKKGETLYSIARKYGISVDEMIKINHLSNNDISEGQVLIIKTTVGDVAIADTMTFETPLDSSAEVGKPGDQDMDIEQEDEFSLRYKEMLSNGNYYELDKEGLVSWIYDAASFSSGFYALHESLAVGSLIKITNPINHRSIYAKVIGNLPPNDDHIVLKLPADAREQLIVHDEKFLVEISWLNTKH